MADTAVEQAEAQNGIVKDLRAWAVEQALPLWSTTGWDAARGGFIERLHKDGSADAEAPRRVRVHGALADVHVDTDPLVLGEASSVPE